MADFAGANAGAAAFGEAGALPVGGVGGGLFPGIGKGFNLDIGANGGIGGGFPWLGGLGGLGGGLGGVPYVPFTPLGSYWGFKGDLIVPIVAVGVVLFLIIIVVLAIKAAFAWKINLLANKGSKFARATAADNVQQEGAQPPEESQLNELAHMVLTAIQSQTCAQKVVCDIGTYARTRDGLANLLRILESMVPTAMAAPLVILRDSAEGKYDCGQKYPCGNDQAQANTAKNSTTENKQG